MSRQFLRFAFVGGIGFIVDAGGVFLLTHWGWPPIVARIPSTSIAILVTWLLNRRVTFCVAKPRTRRELMRYVVIATSSALLNFAIYSAFVLMGVQPVLAVVFATAILLLFSFFAYRHLVFN